MPSSSGEKGLHDSRKRGDWSRCFCSIIPGTRSGNGRKTCPKMGYLEVEDTGGRGGGLKWTGGGSFERAASSKRRGGGSRRQVLRTSTIAFFSSPPEGAPTQRDFLSASGDFRFDLFLDRTRIFLLLFWSLLLKKGTRNQYQLPKK